MTRRAIIVFLCFVAPSLCQARKLDRALLMAGGGFQTAIFLGMVDGAVEKGWVPDLVITSCGSSIAAALIQAIPDAAKRRAFVESRAFYELLRTVEIRKVSGLELALRVGNLALAAQTRRRKPDETVYPDVFSWTLMRIPESFDLPGVADRRFLPNGIRALVVAARVLYPKERAGRPAPRDEKLFQETYFTDEETAKLVGDFSTPIARAKPASRVAPETRVVTGRTLLEAARAGINDPSYINPPRVGDDYYLAGSIDLYPLELAKTIANEVTMTYSAFFSDVEENTILTTYGYSNNARLGEIHAMEADYWIDHTRTDELDRVAGFNPRFSTSGVQSGVPATYEEFARKVRAQWQYGRDRATEALERKSRNDKSHIRDAEKK